MKYPFADLPSPVFLAVNGSLLEDLGKIPSFSSTQSGQKHPEGGPLSLHPLCRRTGLASSRVTKCFSRGHTFSFSLSFIFMYVYLSVSPLPRYRIFLLKVESHRRAYSENNSPAPLSHPDP